MCTKKISHPRGPFSPARLFNSPAFLTLTLRFFPTSHCLRLSESLCTLQSRSSIPTFHSLRWQHFAFDLLVRAQCSSLVPFPFPDASHQIRRLQFNPTGCQPTLASIPSLPLLDRPRLRSSSRRRRRSLGLKTGESASLLLHPHHSPLLPSSVVFPLFHKAAGGETPSTSRSAKPYSRPLTSGPSSSSTVTYHFSQSQCLEKLAENPLSGKAAGWRNNIGFTVSSPAQTLEHPKGVACLQEVLYHLSICRYQSIVSLVFRRCCTIYPHLATKVLSRRIL